MDAESQKLSGYDLAYRIFTEAGDDPVSAYIDLVGDETSWLEFKAGMYAREKDREKGENEDDNFWHISKAILAMLNSSGGVVIIGVQDGTFNPVPLAENDPHLYFQQGLDAYLRLAVEDNLPPKRSKWKTGLKGNWQFDHPLTSDQICIERTKYNGCDVVLVLVKPLEDCQPIRHGNDEVMLVRSPNALGRVAELKSFSEMRDWERNRCIRDAKFNALYKKFKQQHASRDFEAILDAKIDDYYRDLAQRARDEMAVFTPLDAAENAFEPENVDSFYSPEAVEWKESASSWLNDDDEDDEEEERENNEQGDDETGDEQDSVFDDENEEEEESDGQPGRRGNLLTLLEETPRAIVSGEPGGGKTTCLTYFALRFQKQSSTDQKILAVFIPMGQWRNGGSLSGMILKAAGLELPQLESLLSSNRIRLVIDAVNECPDHFRAAAILNIQQFLASHTSTPVVLSTRHPEELSSLELPVFQVQPMDEEHRRGYLERYLGKSDATEALLSQLRKMPGGDTISENPMLLRLVVEVYRESPGQKLPAGRAGLYRRSLRSWYKREKGKREESGEALFFSRKEALSLLAELAFSSRLRGFRSVPLEEVRELWGDSFEEKIAEICQGPIVYIENEFLKFRHETFQEYLTAEYLVKKPDILQGLTHEDYAQWGMPLAYLVELCDLDNLPLPESAWLAAWSLNPWLGVALTDEETAKALLRKEYSGKRPLVDGFELGISNVEHNAGQFFMDLILGRFDISLYDRYSWYSRSDTALAYIVNVSKSCVKRWKQVEILQAVNLTRLNAKPQRSLWQAIRLAKSWILLRNSRVVFSRIAFPIWRQWIQIANPFEARELIESGLAVVSDFSANGPRWIKKATPNTILAMQKIKFDNEMLSDAIAKSIASATPDQACALIAHGWASSEDFSERVKKWLLNPQYLYVRKFVQQLGNDEVHAMIQGKIRHWIERASVQSAMAMIEDGIAEIKDFGEKFRAVAVFCPKFLQIKMRELGLLTEEDVISIETQLNVAREYRPGDVVEGRIATLTELGAIVCFNGIYGFLSLKDIPWEANNTETELVINQNIKAIIMSIDSTNGRISLRIKPLSALWDGMTSRYPLGAKVHGKVVYLAPYGAFIELEPGIRGLVHVKEFSWTKRIVRASDMLNIGDEVDVVVLDVNKYAQKIALSIRQTKPNPLDTILSSYLIGQLVKGKVSKIASFGAFVEVEDGVDGLIHISQISNYPVAKVKDVLTVGQEVEARIIRVDNAQRRIALSMKAVGMDEEEFNQLVAEQQPFIEQQP